MFIFLNYRQCKKADWTKGPIVWTKGPIIEASTAENQADTATDYTTDDLGKVIKQKSRGEVSPVEPNTIKCVYLAYLKFKNEFMVLSSLSYATFQCKRYNI